MRLWNIDTQRCEAELDGHARAVISLVALPDGRLMSASEDATLALWLPSSGVVTPTTFQSQRFPDACALLPDGRVVVRTRAASFSSRYGANFAEFDRALETRVWRERGETWVSVPLAPSDSAAADSVLESRPFDVEHSFIALPGVARLYVDASITQSVLACGGERYIVATAAGGVHFAELVPAVARHSHANAPSTS